jgi:hypothetical protein
VTVPTNTWHQNVARFDHMPAQDRWGHQAALTRTRNDLLHISDSSRLNGNVSQVKAGCHNPLPQHSQQGS